MDYRVDEKVSYLISIRAPIDFNRVHFGERTFGMVLLDQRWTVQRTCMISVVMPVYNQSAYLADAVNSILKQAGTSWNLSLLTTAQPTIPSRSCRGLRMRIPEFVS